jgi:hypothetical protein
MPASNEKEPAKDNELTPPLIQISLDYYLSLACRGLDEIAVVSREFGLSVQRQDNEESYTHVEFPEDRPHLANIYRIQSWRTCLKRDAEKKHQAEVSRQIRFALEEEETKRKLKIQRKRDILQETIADVKKLHGVDVALKLTKGQPMTDLQRIDFFISLVYKALMGEHPKAASKFAITAETIKEFSTLPRDPEFKNRYITGIEPTSEGI